MTTRDERMAAIIARLIPEGAVLLSDIVDREWMGADGYDAESAWCAMVWADDRRRSDSEWRAYPVASVLNGPPPPGSMIELMALRIAALEDANEALRGDQAELNAGIYGQIESILVGAGEECPTNYQTQFDWGPYEVAIGRVKDLVRGHVSALTEEVATLRAILASVPSPEDEP